MVSGYCHIKRPKIESIPTMVTGEEEVQNLTRWLSVQSKANIIIGYGAPVTIRTKASGDLALSLSLHIISNEKSGSICDLDLLKSNLLPIARKSRLKQHFVRHQHPLTQSLKHALPSLSMILSRGE